MVVRQKLSDGSTLITGDPAGPAEVYFEFNHISQGTGATGWVRMTGGAITVPEDGKYVVQISETFNAGTVSTAGRRALGVASSTDPDGPSSDLQCTIGNQLGNIGCTYTVTFLVNAVAGDQFCPWRYTDVSGHYGAGTGWLRVYKLNAGAQGPQGLSGTVTITGVTTGAPGSAAAVMNTGSPQAAQLQFTIPRGDVGATGLTGTRWGSTTIWVLGTASNALVAFPDGLPPRVGDLVVGTNGFDPGQVSKVTAVIDATHADLTSSSGYPNIRGPQGVPGNTNIILNDSSLSTDLNTVTETGFYRVASISNGPAGAPAFTPIYIEVIGSGNDTTQMLRTRDNLHVWTRARVAGTWSTWRELGVAARISHARATATFALTANTQMRLTGWNTEDYTDPMATLSTDGYTINEAGLYEVHFSIQIANNVTSARRFWSIGHGAAFAIPYDSNMASLVDITQAGSPAGMTEGLFNLAVGDKVWGMAFSAIADNIGPGFRKLQLKKVG